MLYDNRKNLFKAPCCVFKIKESTLYEWYNHFSKCYKYKNLIMLYEELPLCLPLVPFALVDLPPGIPSELELVVVRLELVDAVPLPLLPLLPLGLPLVPLLELPLAIPSLTEGALIENGLPVLADAVPLPLPPLLPLGLPRLPLPLLQDIPP